MVLVCSDAHRESADTDVRKSYEAESTEVTWEGTAAP